jgi:WD40 repeat protein
VRLESETFILASPHVAELAPDDRHLVCGGTSVWLCDRTSHFVRRYTKASGYRVSNVFVTRGGRVVAQQAAPIRMWAWRTAKLGASFKPGGHHNLRSVDVAARRALTTEFSPTKNQAFTVWDLGRERAVSMFREPKSFVIGAVLSADGGTVVHGGTDGVVRFYDVGSSKHFARSPGKGWVDVVARSDDGRFYASGGRGGVVHVWTPNGALLRRIPYAANVTGLAMSPDGEILVVHGAKNQPTVFEVASGKRVETLGVHPASAMFGGVRSVRFSRDGKRLVTAGNDSRVCVLLRD